MQPEKLIELFNAHKVTYLIIGASACAVHGFPRATRDLDIFIEASPRNAERVLGALSEFGYDVTDLTIDDVLHYKLLFRQYWLDTDIHPFAKGISFSSAWKKKFRAPFNGVPAAYVSLNDLIRMKRIANRPKDQEDLRQLLHIRKILKERAKPKRKKVR